MAKVGQPMLPIQGSVAKSDPPPVQQPAVAQSPETNIVPSQHQMVPGQSQIPYSYSPGPPAQTSMPVMHSHAEYQRAAASPHVVPQIPIQMMQNSSSTTAFHPAGIMAYSEVPRSTYNPVQPVPVAMGGDILPTILLESQNSNSKLKSLIEKVDEVSEKVSKLKSTSETHSHGFNPSMEIMDASQISFNINRIVQENERVKKQILERDKLVQNQSDKIADLLQQNQKLVEESHDQIAKRNVSFQERYGQSQEKTLQLEQEKLHLTNKLSDATAKICELQLNFTNATEKANSLEKLVKASSGQHENELRLQQLETELASARSLLENVKDEKEKLRISLEQSQANALRLNEKMKSMQQEFETERSSLQEEVKNIKAQHEDWMKSMQAKYQSETTGAAEIKKQLEESWKEKCKEMIAKVSEAAEEKMAESESEKETLVKKLEAYQEKMIQLKGMYEQKVKSEDNLKAEVSEFEATKQKYENLRKQAMTMKQKYEATIEELREKLEQGESTTDGDATTQIKSVMNKVFQEVRAKVSPEDNYSGSDILGIVLNIIKSTTLTLLNPNAVKEEESEEEEDEDEADDSEISEKEEDAESESEEEEKEDEEAGKKDEDPEETATEDDGAKQTTEENVGDAEKYEDQYVVVGNATPAEQQESDPIQSPGADVPPNVGTDDRQSNEDVDSSSQQEEVPPDVDNQPADVSVEHETGKEEGKDTESVKSIQSPVVEKRTPSPDSDVGGKPSPPPLFDDDDEEDNDIDWLK